MKEVGLCHLQPLAASTSQEKIISVTCPCRIPQKAIVLTRILHCPSNLPTDYTPLFDIELYSFTLLVSQKGLKISGTTTSSPQRVPSALAQGPQHPCFPSGLLTLLAFLPPGPAPSKTFPHSCLFLNQSLYRLPSTGHLGPSNVLRHRCAFALPVKYAIPGHPSQKG